MKTTILELLKYTIKETAIWLTVLFVGGPAFMFLAYLVYEMFH